SLLDSFVTQLSPYSLLISPDIPSISFFSCRRHGAPRYLHSFPTRRSSDLRRATIRSAFYVKGYPRGQQRSTDQTVRRVREYPGCRDGDFDVNSVAMSTPSFLYGSITISWQSSFCTRALRYPSTGGQCTVRGLELHNSTAIVIIPAVSFFT